MNWYIEELREAANSGDSELYKEIIEQLRQQKEETHIQALETLISMSWNVVEYELGYETLFNKTIYDLYYNQNLKQKTLIDILGEEIFNTIYE